MVCRQRFVLAFGLATALQMVVFASLASAAHPESATWEATVDEDDTPSCLTVTPADSRSALVHFDNQCSNTMTLESATCDGTDCKPSGEAFEVENKSSRKLEMTYLDVSRPDEEGTTVDIVLGWALGAGQSGSIEVTATWRGYTGGGHGDTGTQTGDGGSGGSDTDSTSSEGEGCSAGGRLRPLPAFCLLFVLAAFRRR